MDERRTGEQTVTYSADFLLWHGQARRVVTTQDTLAPEITLTEKKDSYTVPGTPYEEDGFSATDRCDGDLTAQVQREEKDGKVYYTVTDRAGNTAEACARSIIKMSRRPRSRCRANRRSLSPPERPSATPARPPRTTATVT